MAIAALSLGNNLSAQRKHAEAERMYLEALETEEDVLGPDHPSLATVHTNLSDLYVEMGDLERGEAELKQASRILQTAGDDASVTDVASLDHNLAGILHRRGAHAEAVELFGRALSSFERALGEDHPTLAFPLVGRANCSFELGRLVVAITDARRAVALRSTDDAPPDLLGEALNVLARALATNGEHTEALSAARAALDAYEQAGPSFGAARKSVEEVLAVLEASPRTRPP